VHPRIPLAAALLLSLAGCGNRAGSEPAATSTSGTAASGASASGSSTSGAWAPPGTVEITVIGTADLHGRVATLPVLSGYVRALRAKNPDGVLLVDAGDMFQGTLESNLDEGATVIEAYKKVGYDAVAIGNHEFDYGPVGPAATVRKATTSSTTAPSVRPRRCARVPPAPTPIRAAR
jgi:5'-nucleotidase